MLIRSFFAVFCLFLSGCFAHSFPTANSFIEVGEVSDHKAEVVQVFVDANGTFYPNGWQRFSSIRSPWKADSLLNSLDEGEALRSLIEKEEVRQLQEIKNAADRSDRIFVLIHGFNNTVDEAMPAYSEIERKLDLREDDLVVRFYWDGLTGKRGGQAKIWFNAVGYSQLAGLRGLRRMLSQINDKPIYLISHSRGASVITSALANPVYDPDFLEDTQAVVRTWGSEYQNFFAPGPVAENENRFHILMLAPAIDRV
ncbi:MAG: alpha/beta hydrolase, partial [Hyphomicrobiales bacterium]